MKPNRQRLYSDFIHELHLNRCHEETTDLHSPQDVVNGLTTLSPTFRVLYNAGLLFGEDDVNEEPRATT